MIRFKNNVGHRGQSELINNMPVVTFIYNIIKTEYYKHLDSRWYISLNYENLKIRNHKITNIIKLELKIKKLN